MQFNPGDLVTYKRNTYIVLRHCSIKFNSMWSPGYAYKKVEGDEEVFVRYQGDFEDKFKKVEPRGKENT